MSHRFAKIDAQGRALPHDAADWVAVYDAASGLMWSANDVNDAETSVDFVTAEKLCAQFDLAGANDWRLPTVDELFALADRTRHDPAIDPDFFPSCESDWYWTSSPAAWSPSSDAWFVGFGNGDADTYSRDAVAFVRAVRSVPVAPAPGQ
jgi:hypothetical protein